MSSTNKKVWITIIVLVMLVGLPLGSWYFLFRGQKMWDDRFIPEFHLTSPSDPDFTQEDVLGKFHVAQFTFMACEQPYCDEVWKAMKQVQQAFADNDQVLLVTYTIDPDPDSLPVLEEYAKQYGAKEGKWFFVTGSKQELADALVEGYRITKMRFREPGRGTDYLKGSPRLALVQPNGYIKGYYPVEDQKDIDRLIGDLRELLKEAKD